MGVFEVSTRDDWDQRHMAARNQGKAVVIDFGAEWCGPCRTMSPIYDALSSKFIKTMVFLRADAASELAQAFSISALPTFQVWRGGNKVGELVGASKDLESWLEQFSKPFTTTFHGKGRTLAGGGVGTHAEQPLQASEGTLDGTDEGQAVTTLTIRLMDGSRLTGRFNTSHTVGDIHRYIRQMRPDGAASFKLMTSYPTTALTDWQQTLESAQLLNSVVIQKA